MALLRAREASEGGAKFADLLPGDAGIEGGERRQLGRCAARLGEKIEERSRFLGAPFEQQAPGAFEHFFRRFVGRRDEDGGGVDRGWGSAWRRAAGMLAAQGGEQKNGDAPSPDICAPRHPAHVPTGARGRQNRP
jgi:hypothetical protein